MATQGSIPKHLRQPQPLRLPPVEDRLDNAPRKTGQGKEPADVGVCDTYCSARSVIDLAWPLSIRRRQRCARTSALIRISSRLGLQGGPVLGKLPPLIVIPELRDGGRDLKHHEVVAPKGLMVSNRSLW